MVKLFGWENAMKKKIEQVREVELANIKKFNYTIALMMFVITALSTLLSMSTFTMYSLLGTFFCALDISIA